MAALLLTVSIWGTTFVATKVALRDVPPFTLTLLRFLLASLVLVPLAWLEGRRGWGERPWGPLLLAGLVGGCLYFGLQNLGLVYTSASRASLILASIPALTALLSALFLREPIERGRALGVVASVSGVVVIVLAGKAVAHAGGSIVGDLLIGGTALAWATYTVLAKDLEGRATPTLVSAATVGLGGLFLLPVAGCELLRHPLPTPSPEAWLATGYLGLVASTLPFLLWNYALNKIDASEAAVYTNLVPVVAVLSSMLLLDERLAPAQWVGGAMVLLGVWAASKRSQKGLSCA
jgi:drug/metabolite transporter (DMT)-like permease